MNVDRARIILAAYAVLEKAQKEASELNAAYAETPPAGELIATAENLALAHIGFTTAIGSGTSREPNPGSPDQGTP